MNRIPDWLYLRRMPDWLYLRVSQALIGEIYSSIRAIVVGLDEERVVTLRYYLDREVGGADYESMDKVISLILADTLSNGDIKCVKGEMIFSTKKKNDLDWLGGFVYSRME
ncbi:colicin [Achromobacter insuavis]|uniref:colicin n=1 Tax=Achromobacter insuavis TaxID=1287735 RepID=UPI001EEC94B4|nr:colicin [Achromobacter insuavis]